MDCTEIRPLISYYHDGEATPEERARVERHLAGCEDCRHVLAEYRAISGDLREMALPAPPVGLRRDVWRAIEAQQAGTGARVFGAAGAGAAASKKRDRGTMVQFPQNRRKSTFAGAFASFESGWSKALTAALVIGAMFIVLGVLIVLQKGNNVQAATLIEKPPFSDYGQALHIQFSNDVVENDVKLYTTITRVDGAAPVTITDFKKSYETRSGAPGGTLTIKPDSEWARGAEYNINIDATKIGLKLKNQKLGTESILLHFSTVANTPTPTETPTSTPVPTETPVQPTPTREPTAVADDTPMPNVEPTVTRQVVASATPEPQQPTATTTTAPRPSATNTRPAPPTATAVAPTNTPIPIQPSVTATHVVEPTVTETAAPPKPTSTTVATATATAIVVKGTPTATLTPTPGKGTPTPIQPCNIMPVNGFGKLWSEKPDLRDRVGCPKEYETALQQAAEERFQSGYMFWRGDTRMIYVFLWGSANDSVGTWQEFPDTWREGDPEPTPTQPLPAGTYTPMRGFGKLWRENQSIQLALGNAIEPERAVVGAWQTYERGYALWTENKVIRFMFKDSNASANIWMRFEDTYVMPTATPPR